MAYISIPSDIAIVIVIYWMVIYSNINQNTNSSIFQNSDWVYWIAVAIVPSLLGAAVIANLINKPLELLSKAANRVRIGDFQLFA
ncbi:MAG: hypothetical protein IPI14_10005 [Polaromonas sp.]|nr:hypothetical protein [Polaromonas sp.]